MLNNGAQFSFSTGQAVGFYIADANYRSTPANYKIFFSSDGMSWTPISMIYPWDATIFMPTRATEIKWDAASDITSQGNYLLRLELQSPEGVVVNDVVQIYGTPFVVNETVNQTNKTCRCISMQVKGSGRADGSLNFPPPARSPQPGDNSDSKQLGPVAGPYSFVHPRTQKNYDWKVVSYNFELHSVVEGPIGQCFEFQKVKSSYWRGDTKYNLYLKPNGDRAFDTAGNLGFAGAGGDHLANGSVNSSSFGPDDYEKPFTGDWFGLKVFKKEHLPIQGTDQTIIHWIDSPANNADAHQPLPRDFTETRKMRYWARVGGPGGICDCFWTIITYQDTNLDANPAPQLLDVSCS